MRATCASYQPGSVSRRTSTRCESVDVWRSVACFTRVAAAMTVSSAGGTIAHPTRSPPATVFDEVPNRTERPVVAATGSSGTPAHRRWPYGIVLDHDEAPALGQLGQPQPSRGRQGRPRRVLEGGDRVDELHRHAVVEDRREAFDVEPVVVDGHRVHAGAGELQHLAGAEVQGIVSGDVVAGFEEDAAEQVERLLRAGRHEHVVGDGAEARSRRDPLPEPGIALGRRVLERRRSAGQLGRDGSSDVVDGDGLGARQASRQ